MTQLRYYVTRQWVKHKNKFYRCGDMLPEDFTERDKHRNIYTRRIGQKEFDLPDPIILDLEEVDVGLLETEEAESIPKGINPSGSNPAAITTPNGASALPTL